MAASHLSPRGGNLRFDIHSLMRALPVWGLDPLILTQIPGFPRPPITRDIYVAEDIKFLEPPAGRNEPYVDPVDFMRRIFIYQGINADKALKLAEEQYNMLRRSLSIFERAVFHDSYFEPLPEHISIVTLLKHMRENKLAPDHLIGFFEKASEVTRSIPMFEGEERRKLNEKGSNFWYCHKLTDLPDFPFPRAMIEFIPAPWRVSRYNRDDDPIFWAWRKAMKPITASLEKELGESVYYSDEQIDEISDYVHRFLILHLWCSYKPDSSYVRYLVEASGAADVDELKAALIDPANYVHPFKMNEFFCSVMRCKSMTYLPPGKRKTVGVVFASENARPVAEAILLQQIGADVVIAAPEELLKGDTLCRQATRFCRHSGSFFIKDGVIPEPVTFLAQLDELYVVADVVQEDFEELLWKAVDLKIPAYHCYEGGSIFEWDQNAI